MVYSTQKVSGSQVYTSQFNEDQKQLDSTDEKVKKQTSFSSQEVSSFETAQELLGKLTIKENDNHIPSPVKIDNVNQNSLKNLNLDVIAYEEFANGNLNALSTLKKALLEKGIVGIRSVPGYKERVQELLKSGRKFSSLPLETKQKYMPNRLAGEFTGFEVGAEKFQRDDGTWVTDDGKYSYYGYAHQDLPENRWPSECPLKEAFLGMGRLMFDTGLEVLKSIELIKPEMNISFEKMFGVGRFLHYKTGESGNPLWCGGHFDHGILTALLPGFYYKDEKTIPEPEEAGLFVRETLDGEFKKVIANDPDVMLFQAGEWGQILANDGIKATKHEVHSAKEKGIERFTFAVFIDPAFGTRIKSTSILTKDSRYGNEPDGTCLFDDWNRRSLERYLVTK